MDGNTSTAARDIQFIEIDCIINSGCSFNCFGVHGPFGPPGRIRHLHFVIVQRDLGIETQLNDRPGHVAAAGQRAPNGRLISAFQRHGSQHAVNGDLGFGQVVHVRVRVGLRLRGPRFLAGQCIARRHGVVLRLGHLRAVVFVSQNFGLAPLIQFVRAVRGHGIGARFIPIIAGAIGTVVPVEARPNPGGHGNVSHAAACAGALISNLGHSQREIMGLI